MMQSQGTTPATGSDQPQINAEEFAILESRVEARYQASTQEVDQIRVKWDRSTHEHCNSLKKCAREKLEHVDPLVSKGFEELCCVCRRVHCWTASFNRFLGRTEEELQRSVEQYQLSKRLELQAHLLDGSTVHKFPNHRVYLHHQFRAMTRRPTLNQRQPLTLALCKARFVLELTV